VHGLYSSTLVALKMQKMQYINPPSRPTQRGVVRHKCGENTWGSHFVLFVYLQREWSTFTASLYNSR